MNGVLYAAAIYVFLLVVLQFAGKRTLGETTTFDFVLLLVIAEATQQAFLGEDFSLTRALVAISTLVGLDVLLGDLKQRWRRLGRIMKGVPVLILEGGRMLADVARQARVDETDVLEAARRLQGLERLDQIKYAVLERGGGISVILKPGG